MHELIPLLGVVSALVVGVVSPGPSFMLVARVAVSTSRPSGLAAALGMGVGGSVFALAALLGLQAVLLAVPTMYLGLKVLGGLYLCYLGYRIFVGAKQPLEAGASGYSQKAALTRAFWLGLTTQLSNPKTAIVYASVFAAFLPVTFSFTFAAVLLLAVFFIEAGWYAFVALVLSSPQPRRLYLNYKAWVDRAAGLVMVGLGIKLLASAHRA